MKEKFKHNQKKQLFKNIIRIIGFVILTFIIVLVGLLWISSPGKVKPVVDENGERLEGSMAMKKFVIINGVKMGMIIKGNNPTKPVLLFVHGGPGMPEYFLNEDYPTKLEQYFTVCWWDQRGSGLSYSSDIDRETMTVDQMIEDTISVTKFLCEEFSVDNIYLMGHSWGSFIAIQAAAKAPELYHAYIGMAQITNQKKSEKFAFEYMVNKTNELGYAKDAKKLNNYSSILTEDGDVYTYMKSLIRDNLMHKLGIGTTHKMTSIMSGIFWPIMQNREYTLKEKCHIWIGKSFSRSSGLLKEMIDTDISQIILELKVPIYFVHGIYDYTVSYTLARDYFNRLKAPLKGFYTFNNSAHTPLFEEPEKMLEILINDVLSGSTELSDNILI